MGLTKYYIGDLIELVNETNSKGKYGADDVRGMTITKEIIPTKADVSNTDLSKFLIVHPEEFVFNPRTHGKRIGFGYNNSSENFIISWNNIAFRVKSEAKDIVLPSYLFLHFNRDEWDREACFRSWGSSTEVFSWDALCEMKLTLPSIAKQRKYVDVYLALQNNLAAYQSKVEELKTVCDGYIDKIKKVASKTKLVELLEPIDKRNSDLAYSGVQGININKNFFPTVANVDENNTHNYKIVEQNQFAFSGMQTGRDKCIRIALHEESYPIIISPAYTVFKVKSESVLSHYIMLWFARQEVDRYGWFASDGSIRSNLDLERLYDMTIPLPDISIQQKIVNIHKCYIERQQIAAQLKEQLGNLCPILIKGSLQTDN
ncbi:MAG: restriction endonuclease subunit S [Prevotella sp.]|nr:restriction endonuclease subunit S [Prevotella sp.]